MGSRSVHQAFSSGFMNPARVEVIGSAVTSRTRRQYYTLGVTQHRRPAPGKPGKPTSKGLRENRRVALIGVSPR